MHRARIFAAFLSRSIAMRSCRLRRSSSLSSCSRLASSARFSALMARACGCAAPSPLPAAAEGAAAGEAAAAGAPPASIRSHMRIGSPSIARIDPCGASV